MEIPRSAAVLGLGLIGGSLARDLAAYGLRVAGWDRDGAAVRAARDEGVLADALPADLAGVERYDLVVLALPVDAAVALLERLTVRLLSSSATVRLVTDCGSTKTRIVETATRLKLGPLFVGGHPLAGDHRSGWAASRTGLFRDALVYLTPPTTYRVPTLDLARWMWTTVGARPTVVATEYHDPHLAWISHLPQLASTTLGRTLAAAAKPRSALGPGGRDVTRLAGSGPELWAEIALDNAGALLPALDAFAAHLADLRDAVARRDRAALARLLAEGRAWSDAEHEQA